ncbi:MAG: prolipoprotein diacylglyceryl transferase [Kiritimatiellia bacterium]
MHSILLELGPFTLKAFGLMMALGFACAWYAAVRLSRGTHRNPDYISNLVVWLMLSGVLGARLAYVAEHWTQEFAGHPSAILRVDLGGLMFYGGLAGATLALFLFARWRREPFLALADLLLAVLPLGHCFGRIGCFLNGCCHGHISHSWLAVTFPAYSPAWTQQVADGDIPPTAAQSDPVLPTQLIEAAANLLLFLLLYRLYRRHREQYGLVTGTYLMGYAVIRFLIEPLRGDSRLQVAGVWSIGQFISILLFVAGASILLWRRRKAPAKDSSEFKTPAQ